MEGQAGRGTSRACETGFLVQGGGSDGPVQPPAAESVDEVSGGGDPRARWIRRFPPQGRNSGWRLSVLQVQVLVSMETQSLLPLRGNTTFRLTRKPSVTVCLC